MGRVIQACALVLLPIRALAQSGIELMDKHLFVELMVDEFEFVDFGDENDFDWDLDVSVGGDLHKFWLKTRGHRRLNAHPGGMSVRRGMAPSICVSRSTSCRMTGIEPMRPCV